MLRLCCCGRPAAAVAPARAAAAPLPLDLVADLPPPAWDSSALATYDEKDKREASAENATKLHDGTILLDLADDVFGDGVSAEIPASEAGPSPRRSRSPSIRVEDYSERSAPSPIDDARFSPARSRGEGSEGPGSPKSFASAASRAERRSPSGKSATPPRAAVAAASAAASRAPSRSPSPSPQAERSRDVRTALAECIVPARHEDWEAIVAGLGETARLAGDAGARAPAAWWRAAARGAAAHVRSLRSRVARAACGTLGALFEHRGRALDPELEESAAALLERCADVNRFLRADAGAALARLAAGGAAARAAAALCRRGAAHRAGPVRAAAAAALARLVSAGGAARALSLAPETRALVLRAAGDMLSDACAEARSAARLLCAALAEDARFRPLLKEAMPPSRYRAIEKLLDKLQ